MNLFCSSDPRPSFVEKVLVIKFAKEHVVSGENKIMTMLKTDFEYLDFYMLIDHCLLLVKVDSGTIPYNRVMREW